MLIKIKCKLLTMHNLSINILRSLYGRNKMKRSVLKAICTHHTHTIPMNHLEMLSPIILLRSTTILFWNVIFIPWKLQVCHHFTVFTLNAIKIKSRFRLLMKMMYVYWIHNTNTKWKCRKYNSQYKFYLCLLVEMLENKNWYNTLCWFLGILESAARKHYQNVVFGYIKLQQSINTFQL